MTLVAWFQNISCIERNWQTPKVNLLEIENYSQGGNKELLPTIKVELSAMLAVSGSIAFRSKYLYDLQMFVSRVWVFSILCMYLRNKIVYIFISVNSA